MARNPAKPPIRAWRAEGIGREALPLPPSVEGLFCEAVAARRKRLARQLRQERRLGAEGRAGYDLARHLRLSRALSAADE